MAVEAAGRTVGVVVVEVVASMDLKDSTVAAVVGAEASATGGPVAVVHQVREDVVLVARRLHAAVG